MVVRCGVALLGVMAASASAAPKPTRVQLDLDSEASLTKAGFHRNAGGKTTFTAGTLVIDSPSYEEWSQLHGFTQTAGDGPGWAVEARVKLDAPCSKPGTGMWIHDGYHFVHFAITDHELVLMSPPAKIEIGPTDHFRTLRLEVDGDALTVAVDGKQVWAGAALDGQATIDFMFGALGDGCAVNRSTWDYVAYETTPVAGAVDRMSWHPGTHAADVLAALGPAIATPKTLSDAQASCIGFAALDGAVRDLLPAGYDAIGAHMPARELRALRWPFEIEHVRNEVREYGQPRRLPICDPVPGHPCGPRNDPPSYPQPAFTHAVLDALDGAMRWTNHPRFAVEAVAAVGRAYAEAIAAKVPGADAAAKRLATKLATCR